MSRTEYLEFADRNLYLATSSSDCSSAVSRSECLDVEGCNLAASSSSFFSTLSRRSARTQISVTCRRLPFATKLSRYTSSFRLQRGFFRSRRHRYGIVPTSFSRQSSSFRCSTLAEPGVTLKTPRLVTTAISRSPSADTWSNWIGFTDTKLETPRRSILQLALERISAPVTALPSPSWLAVPRALRNFRLAVAPAGACIVCVQCLSRSMASARLVILNPFRCTL
mmetsp:Transcript_24196/g.64567  ORF Transcript_24196/g.64567 Transcript_24196/m.64567 type:complete len:224 (+) Transcript_24196:142-813(+)